jgi:hypothetical protein
VTQARRVQQMQTPLTVGSLCNNGTKISRTLLHLAFSAFSPMIATIVSFQPIFIKFAGFVKHNCAQFLFYFIDIGR